MRFRSVVLVAAACASLAAFGSAEKTRAELSERLRQQLPGLGPADYVHGSAAFDPELKARVEQGVAEAAPVVAAGKRLWERKFRNGRSLSACFPNGGRRIAGTYPQYDVRLKRVLTLEMAVNQCLKANGETVLELADAETMGAITAYVRSLSDGQKVTVRVPAAAEDRFEQGRRLYFSRMGQQNFACASCHVQGAGKRYADAALSPPLGQATHWPLIRGGRAVTMQARIRECLELMGAAAFPAGSDELNHLEYFLAFLSNGLPLKANAWRPAPQPQP